MPNDETAGHRFHRIATVLNCFSRKVVGWSIADHMRTDLAADALRMATRTRGGVDGALFHSDHGAQYGSGPSRQPLRPARGQPVDGRGRQQREQRGLRAILCVLERRDPPRNPRLQRRCDLQVTVFARLACYNTRRRHFANGRPAPTNTNGDTTRLNSRSPQDAPTRVHHHGEGRPCLRGQAGSGARTSTSGMTVTCLSTGSATFASAAQDLDEV
ncbi:DDE-type integrase/transposase/recombinase [Streptomyces sp. NPDC102264]|uniref:DDE-type integrase/transposase/recombinase n=1 Tax=Streptomyces sp. NPDC102264 TaxID=3366149 RepID=UPI00381CF352